MKSFIFNLLVWLNRPTIQSVIVGLALIFVVSIASALELIVADDPHCSYCNQFHSEIGDAYNQSPHAEWAPMEIILYSISYKPVPEQWPEWFRAAINEGRIDPINGTPTFIFYETAKGEDAPQEIGRIVGYGGKDWFYNQMEHYKTAYGEWKKTN